jgi:tetratricopeptide (TPR) repeat protein
LHKPTEVNQTQFWNVDFNVGFSTLVTALGTVGFLGLIAWLVPLALVLAGATRAMRLSILGREDRGVAAALIMGSLFLLAALALYVPSQNLILLGFVLSGATFGFLWRQGQESTAAAERASSRLAMLLVGVVALILLALSVVVVFVAVRRTASEIFVNRGALELQKGNVDSAFQNAAIAARMENTGNVLRLAASAGGAKLVQIAQDATLPQEEARAKFEAALQQTIATGNGAAALNPNDYRPRLILANVYDFLATLKVQGAYESATMTYAQAQEHNPNNPAIPFALARLEATRGNMEGARTEVGKALTLKPNYTDAILLVVQLDIAQNDIPSAINAATAAAQTAPGVAPIWLQLGLLYYVAGNASNAALAFEQSIALVPEYANAKYFLGLSYAMLNRNEDAIKQFEDLTKTNPDNAEVKQILENLQAGKTPFEGAATPVTPKSQVRPPAPIEE